MKVSAVNQDTPECCLFVKYKISWWMHKKACFEFFEYLFVVKLLKEFIAMKYPNRKLLFTFTVKKQNLFIHWSENYFYSTNASSKIGDTLHCLLISLLRFWQLFYILLEKDRKACCSMVIFLRWRVLWQLWWLLLFRLCLWLCSWHRCSFRPESFVRFLNTTILADFFFGHFWRV